ncbi:uncharacterized protein HD556DRAFT_1314571 [Suillus plorans]|uniref:Uncharacterized protein n=1 Tax=Suillus plorans TaxID=116603 RepID=A0A9P7DAV3_9AGAM|nr:uncharacterized protein HD556DRAFT_1314570 [Suillus plorans]XP_041152511.1 uncharacterized protein HD556DRAFT_1314571 [Suillus plorans]KAG1785025.1 hypothetical protein HD556DRAFT_1314570 [Suillus plorans]KAG1785026.1 hypothetical protein HD556DRAFT_1314571 [Suillus plorans]
MYHPLTFTHIKSSNQENLDGNVASVSKYTNRMIIIKSRKCNKDSNQDEFKLQLKVKQNQQNPPNTNTLSLHSPATKSSKITKIKQNQVKSAPNSDLPQCITQDKHRPSNNKIPSSAKTTIATKQPTSSKVPATKAQKHTTIKQNQVKSKPNSDLSQHVTPDEYHPQQSLQQQQSSKSKLCSPPHPPQQ